MRPGTWSARTFLRAKPSRTFAYFEARVRTFGVSARMRYSSTPFEVVRPFGFCRELFQKGSCLSRSKLSGTC